MLLLLLMFFFCRYRQKGAYRQLKRRTTSLHSVLKQIHKMMWGGDTDTEEKTGKHLRRTEMKTRKMKLKSRRNV